MAHHEIKCAFPFFGNVRDGSKTFEVRINDRDYRYGDTVRLHEWDTADGYTGRFEDRIIGFVTDFNQAPGYVVFSLLDMPLD